MTPQPARPIALAVNPAGIPQALKDRAQWVCWDYALVQTRWTKRPLNAQTGVLASATDPASWTTFAVALAAMDRHGYAGIGYVFSPDDGLAGVDVDHCRGAVDGELTIYAQTIADELNSYTEVTPSGTGLHIIVAASLPDGKGRKSVKHGIELYDRGRFFTMTGARLSEWPQEPQERQAAFDDLYAHLFPLRPVSEAAASPRPDPSPPPPDDTLLIDRAHAAKNGATFARLWRGDTSGNHADDSSADLALCNLLAFWAGPDPARIDRLFRQSGLYRQKWERQDYRDATIGKALAGRTDYYDWSAPRESSGGARFRLVGAEDEDEAPAGLHCTDMGNGQRLVRRHGDDLRYCDRWKSWLVWDGRRFARDETGAVERRAKDTVRAIYGEAADAVSDSDRKMLARWAMRSEAAQRIREMIALARTEDGIAIMPDCLDRDPWLLTVANGAIDLRTGTLRPAQRTDYVTKLAPVTFDPDATCPQWLAFLDRIMGGKAELITFLQRAIGYALTGDVSEHCLFLLYGTGRNGKTTFMETLAALLGDYAQTTPTETLLVRREGGIPNDLARLAGARLVSASESEDGKRLSEALIKQLTGGDTISARFLRAEFFDFRPTFKLFFRTNHKPIVRGTDEGIWSRLKLLPFEVQIPDAERDKALPERLRHELPGILNWALAGCLAWQRDGLGTPTEVDAATGLYRQEMDLLGSFLEECCIIGHQRHVTASDLYKSFVAWTESNGERPYAQRTLGLKLTERGFRVERGTGGQRRWTGLTLG